MEEELFLPRLSVANRLATLLYREFRYRWVQPRNQVGFERCSLSYARAKAYWRVARELGVFAEVADEYLRKVHAFFQETDGARGRGIA